MLSQITEENGLSDSHVQSIFKDSQGFVWVGTSDGLNLLDGSTIQVFRHSEGDISSLLSNDVFSITEDQNKNIWIATSAGISCYIKSGKIFFNFCPPSSPYGASNIVRSVIMDKLNRLWCATDGGLFLYYPKIKSFVAYYNTSSGENFASVNKIVNAIVDKSGYIWLATFDGLWLFDTQNSRFVRKVSKANDSSYEGLTTTIFKDAEDRLWFGNWSNGLKLLDRTNGSVTCFASLPGAVSHITAISELKLSGGHNIICLNGSLKCFDADSKQFQQLPMPCGLTAYPDITCFYQSTDDWIWMGSDKGLWIYNPQRQFFKHHFFKRPITSQSVTLLDWHHQLIIGGEGNDFLTAYDDEYRVKNTFKDLLKRTSINKAVIKSASALCILKESETNLLITNNNGILRFNSQTGESQCIMHNTLDSNSLPNNFIQHLFLDSKKKYWVFPWRAGIYDFNPSSGKSNLLFKGFLQQGTQTKGLVITSAAEDEKGNVWMADLDEGIVLFDRASHKFTKPFEHLVGVRSRSARIIYRNGFCYAFANDRLLIWDTKNRSLQIIKPPLHMQSDIYDMALDSNGYCWMVTKKGLLLYTKSTNSFKQFTTADGLLKNDMDGNLYVRENGKIIFATPTSLTQFNPQELLQSFTSPAAILLMGIEVNGENTSYDNARMARLQYTQNNLVFHWSITDFTSPLRNQYWCRLQGIDADWKYVGNKGEIQYANLSPSSYTLLLKGATANGIAANQIITIQFKIIPPFWKTTWFWAIWIGLAGIVLYWLISRRIKSIKVKAAINQQMIELELKALKAQMNPHFIFNSLSSIQESIISGKQEAASKYLGKFSKLIRLVLENSDKKLITLSQELTYLNLYFELESFRFDDFNFSLNVVGIEDAAFIKLPPMLVQPYIENAIKHGLGHKEGAKNLTVLYRLVETDLLQVTIEDNGIGRQQAALISKSRLSHHQSMGMKITEERLAIQGGNAHRRVEIVDLTDEEGLASGTHVTIYIAI